MDIPFDRINLPGMPVVHLVGDPDTGKDERTSRAIVRADYPRGPNRGRIVQEGSRYVLKGYFRLVVETTEQSPVSDRALADNFLRLPEVVEKPEGSGSWHIKSCEWWTFLFQPAVEAYGSKPGSQTGRPPMWFLSPSIFTRLRPISSPLMLWTQPVKYLNSRYVPVKLKRSTHRGGTDNEKRNHRYHSRKMGLFP